jgi:hypothetical protein
LGARFFVILFFKRNAVLFLYLKEKERTVNASVDRQKKQTRTPSLTGGAALLVLRTLIFMIFDMNIENLNAREGGLLWNS